MPESVGTSRGKPSLADVGSTNGHAVFWARSFGLLVDPTIVLARHVRAAAKGNPMGTFPIMLPVPDDREALLAPAMSASARRSGL